MDRMKQFELAVLVIGWLFAVMIQYVITDTILSNILHLSITGLKDELLGSFLIGVLITIGICLFAKSRIELETALIISVVMALFLGFWPYMSVRGKADWVYPVFFVECAPMCALMWKGAYRWILTVKSIEDKTESLSNVVEAVKSDIAPKPAIQATVVETKEPKQEPKPAEQPPKPQVKPVQRAGWRTKL